MRNELLENYSQALEALYNHVGFVEDWVVYAVDIQQDMYWYINNDDSVCFAETIEQLNDDDGAGDYQEFDIYHQRFYQKWVYRGEQLTLIICDTHTDGNKFFVFFSNEKEIERG